MAGLDTQKENTTLAQLQSLADVPDTLREYETIYILKPDTINDKVAEVNGRVKAIIEERGGKILKVDNWGKRKLAYEIKKERKGIYLFWQYLGSADIVAEFERNMRMLDPVMRYMTIKVDTDVATDARESELTEESYDKASATAADEEEIMLGRSSDSYSDSDDDDDDDDDDDYTYSKDNDSSSDDSDSDSDKGDDDSSDDDSSDDSDDKEKN